MRGLRFFCIFVLLISVAACSKSGRGGKGMGEGDGGNIPLARPGSEMPDVNFDFDSSALDEQAKGTLRNNARWMLDNPGQNVVVEGHCDERGTAEYNLALGERRARSAYDFLRTLGVKGERMSTISYGKELPLDPGHNEAAWEKNRRAHFSLRK